MVALVAHLPRKICIFAKFATVQFFPPGGLASVWDEGRGRGGGNPFLFDLIICKTIDIAMENSPNRKRGLKGQYHEIL